jgi:hypothetical protein
MSEKYIYYISSSTLNGLVDTSALTSQINNSDITRKLDYVNTYGDECDIWFLDTLTSQDLVTLSGVLSIHDGHPLPITVPPTMPDGRPLVRADTRPLDTRTYFTMSGDNMQSNTLGNGKVLMWDFSNNDDIYDQSITENGPTVCSGFKAKRVDLQFLDPVYVKDGTLYFFDAPWGSYSNMYIIVPSGNYYPKEDGPIPAAALGLDGVQRYAYATKDVFYSCYVNRHYMYTSCPMGDELNAEGAQINAVPIGWPITAIIFTDENNTTFKGYGSFEMYRYPTTLVLG